MVTPEKGIFDGVIVSIKIEKLQPSTETLTEYKNRIATNLKRGYPIIKEVAVFTDRLAGEPAYRIENMIQMLDHWEKSIDLGYIKDGKLYQIDVLAKPDLIQQYSSEIKNIIQSVKFKLPVAVKDTKTINTKTTEIKASDLTNKISKKPTKQSNCDSSYPDFCIPSPPPNLNCPNIPQKRFTVSGSDPHGFDNDNDGVGCES